MLLLITVMRVIAEKKLQLNSASLYVVVIFIIGGILIGGGGPPGPPLGYAYARSISSAQKSTRPAMAQIPQSCVILNRNNFFDWLEV